MENIIKSFVAVDFETANYRAESACALGMVRVEGNEIVKRRYDLIRPPQNWFVFTWLHGISWDDVKGSPDFGELWPEITAFIEGADFLAAHNAPFDKGVMTACCNYYGVEMTSIPFKCTVQVSRKMWGIYPTKLPNVCEYFSIPLNHHDAASDTEACARIMIHALEDGLRI